MQTPVKPGAQKRTRTHRHRVITDTWTGDKKEHEPGKLTHRLRNLGIASPFDLPKDPYFLLELFAIVLCRRIHFLSVKTLHYFRVITEPLKFNLQGNQDNRTVRADNEFGARDSQNRNRNSTTPLSLHWRGGPGRVHLPCGDCSVGSVNPACQLFNYLLELSCYPGCPESSTQGFRKYLK